MKATAFDGISRDLGEVSTRRGFLRLLGGAAALGAGVALAAPDAGLGKGRGEGKGRSGGAGRANVSAERRGGGKKIPICYQGATRYVKRNRVGNYPGAVRGVCPVVDPWGQLIKTEPGPQQQPQPAPPPVACTRWIISGGPNPTDQIVIDDDLRIWRYPAMTEIKFEVDGKATTLAPVPFDAKVGEVLYVEAIDYGVCRSLSPLWLHCVPTGQKRKLFPGYGSARCDHGSGKFVDTYLTIEV